MRRWVVFVMDHSILFLILSVATIVLPFFVLRDLNVEAFPDPAPPIVDMVTLAVGKSTEEVERRLTVPTEISLAGMVGLEKINSISLYGLSFISCRFSYATTFKEARQQVINRLATLTLPEGAHPTLIPDPIREVFRYEVVGSNNIMELRGFQEWVIGRFLRTAQGVDDAVAFGGYLKAYVVTVNPDKLIKYGVSLAHVIEALSKSNLNVGGRVVEMGDQYHVVRGIGLIRGARDIENSIVAVKEENPILIRNIAEVNLGNIPRTGIIGHDRRDDVVTGTVTLKKDAMSIPSLMSIHAKVKELHERILPKGIEIKPFYDQWDLIVTVIKKVITLASEGIVLVALMLLVFLGNIRAALITALIIPVSLLFTFSIMAINKESANLLSIGAIDFGIIVDIPLILIENYFRLAHTSGDRAIAQAVDEVGKPIVFAVMIILIAFIPIFNMQGAESQIFMPMAKTYLYTLLFTLALTFSYLVAAKHLFLRNQQEKELVIIAWLKTKYVRLVGVLLAHSKPVLFASFLVLLVIFAVEGKRMGTQFLPKMDEGNVYIRINFPYSMSLNKAYENAGKVRDILLSYPEIQNLDFQAGRPEDGTDPTGAFDTEYLADLKPYSQWTRNITKEELENMIRNELTEAFPNADISFSQFIQDNLEEAMSGVKGENSVKIFGQNLEELDTIAEGIHDRIKDIDGLVDVGIYKGTGQPNVLVEVDRENASAMGLSVQEILDTVATALGGKVVTEVVEGARTAPLFLEFPNQYRKDPEKIATIPIMLPNGGVIALSRVATIRHDTGAFFIYREDFRRYIPVKFAVKSKDLGGTVGKAQLETSKITLPEGVYLEWSGIFNEMLKAFERFKLSIPVSLFLILTVLYVFYGSVRNVMIIMAAPLFGIIGGIVGLAIMGEPLSVSSIVGFVSIIGISALNASLFVNHYIHLILEGKNQAEAILETARDKFRPVLMGGLVAAIGLLPAAVAHGVGTQVQKPLSIVVVGGMIIGTALILLLTPLLLRHVAVKE